MNNSMTDEQRIRLIARLEKDLKESGESQKKERKIITLKKKDNRHENTGFARGRVNTEMS